MISFGGGTQVQSFVDSQLKTQVQGNTDLLGDKTKLPAAFASVVDGVSVNTSQLADISIDAIHPPAPLVGTKTDGLTVDTDAINALLNFASNNKKKLIFPSGTGDYLVDDTLTVGSDTIIEFTGSSYFKLTKPTSKGMVFEFSAGADNVLILNPLIDGGGSEIIVGSSGQNGIGAGNINDVRVIGGHIKNCARGTNNGDGGKAFQVESYNVLNFVAIGTKVENCFMAISSHRDFTNVGGIKAFFIGIHAISCDNFGFVSQTNGSDLTGNEHSIVISDFIAENCGSTDGIFILDRAANVKASGKIIGTNTPVAVIRGRHSRCKFDLEIGVNVTSIIDTNPSTYSVDIGIAQENEYDFNMFGTYSYILKSDTTGSTYPNRALQKSRIKGYFTNDAVTGLVESNAKSPDTFLNVISGSGVRFKGDASYLVNYLGNKFSTVNNFIVPPLSNGWVNYDAVNDDNVGYYKDSNGYVHIQGLVKSGTGVLIFTLPVGFRPKTLLYIPVLYFDGASWQHTMLNVTASGAVQLASTGLSISFLSIRIPPFKAEQ